MKRIAIPCENGRMCSHFGHAAQFMFYDVDESSEITGQETIDSPPHQPGLLPQWLHEHGATVVLAGGMGMRAQELLAERGVEPVVGVETSDPREAAEAWLAGRLTGGANPCDH